MSASVGQQVDRTFSAVGRHWTGLQGVKTHEAESQDLAQFSEAFGCCESIRVKTGHCRARF
jgi:hypothetical protein